MKPKIQKELFSNKSVATPKHDDMLLMFNKDSRALKDVLIQILSQRGYKKFRIRKWEPEKVVTNQNNYYLGSIDLSVGVEVLREGYVDGDGNEIWIWCDIIIEFKPEIKSVSETLRQINVYWNYFGNKNKIFPCVITYSTNYDFREVFESQGITIVYLEKNG